MRVFGVAHTIRSQEKVAAAKVAIEPEGVDWTASKPRLMFPLSINAAVGGVNITVEMKADTLYGYLVFSGRGCKYSVFRTTTEPIAKGVRSDVARFLHIFEWVIGTVHVDADKNQIAFDILPANSTGSRSSCLRNFVRRHSAAKAQRVGAKVSQGAAVASW